MPSSTWFGSRPRRRDGSCAYSAGRRPKARRRCSSVRSIGRQASCQRWRAQRDAPPATRRAADRQRCPAAARWRARGAASGRRRCRGVRDAGDVVLRAVRVAARRDVAVRVAVAQDDVGRRRRARRSCPRRGRSAGAAPGPTVQRAGERRVGALDAAPAPTPSETRSDALRSIAPGSSPASSSTWKPLQMPSTRPPRRGELARCRP